MRNASSVVRVIRSANYPGVYLRPYAEKISDSDGFTIGHGRNLADEFVLMAPPAGGGPYVTSLVSNHRPMLSICMDANAAGKDGKSGKAGIRHGDPEKFKVVRHSDGSVSFESTHVPGVFLSLEMPPDIPGIKPHVCCHKREPRSNERFFLENAAEQPMLRVMTYNLHLMKDSFIAKGKSYKRLAVFDEPDVLDDDMRRDIILQKIIDSNADVVSLQEIWDLGWEYWFGERLAQVYPYIQLGPKHTVEGKLIDFGGIEINIEAYTATSGVVLCSKFPLRSEDMVIKKFTQVHDFLESLSDKGILCVTVDVPGMGDVRIGTTHATADTGGAKCEDVEALAKGTMRPGMKAVMMGDFNAHPDKYEQLKTAIRSNGFVYDVAAVWSGMHDRSPYEGRTIDMANNMLAQFFSTQRDTEPASIIDYIWATEERDEQFYPANVQIPRDWKYPSRTWYWAHANKAIGMPSVADYTDRQVVAGNGGADLGVTIAVYMKAAKTWMHYLPGFKTIASPGIIHFEGQFQLFYRDGYNQVMQRSSPDGITWSAPTYIGFDTGGGIRPVIFLGRLFLLFVTAEPDGGPILRIIKEKAGWGRTSWSGSMSIGIHTRADISAAVFNDKLYVVSFEGSPNESSGIMLSVCDNKGQWKGRNIEHLKSSGAPGIIAHNGLLRMFYRDPNGNALFYAETPDGVQWPVNNYNTGRDSVYSGIYPIELDGGIRLFYAFHNPNQYGPDNYFPRATLMHSHWPDQEVDLSDHYPMIADLELHRRYLDVSAHVLGGETKQAINNRWAGSKGKGQPLDSFTIDASALGEHISISYLAYVQRHGETGWIKAGHPCGQRGLPIEGFIIRLEGDDADKYELSYQAHFEGLGDGPLVPANTLCSIGGRKIEAIRVCIKPVISR